MTTTKRLAIGVSLFHELTVCRACGFRVVLKTPRFSK